jgi:ubiquinone/menaquinone biosynthesis C-methylase UbiE
MKHRHSFQDPSRRYHDRVAKQYDSMYDDAYWEFHDHLTWEAIRPHIPRDLSAKCCDLGCGTGKWGLKILKSGFLTTFVDHSANMIEQTRDKLQTYGPRAKKATLLIGDIIDLPDIPSDSFHLTVAMGDPLSICTDPPRAAREMFRTAAPGGIVIATADNKLAAVEHYMASADLDALESLLHTGKTRWLTNDEREKFELTIFTPSELKKMFEKTGFEVLSVLGKTVLPIRQFRNMLTDKPGAFERLMKLESELSKDPTTASRAAHLQIIARRPVG